VGARPVFVKDRAGGSISRSNGRGGRTTCTPLAQEAEAPGPEYGTISPDMTPESSLKTLERATTLTAPLSTEHAAQVYRIVNLIPLLGWLPMILAPNWRGTRALTTSRSLFAGLGLFYGAFLLKAITEEGPPNFATYEEGPRRQFASHAGLLAGRITWPLICLSGCGSIGLA
jgi:hypothetical protein